MPVWRLPLLLLTAGSRTSRRRLNLLADEEIKRRVLANPKTECTLDKIIRFVEAEESGKYNLSDSVSDMSSFKKQQRDLGKKEEEPPREHLMSLRKPVMKEMI